jgi:hypothetical protein
MVVQIRAGYDKAACLLYIHSGLRCRYLHQSRFPHSSNQSRYMWWRTVRFLYPDVHACALFLTFHQNTQNFQHFDFGIVLSAFDG